jgi:hypothetical protein
MELTSVPQYIFMTWSSIKHGDNFTIFGISVTLCRILVYYIRYVCPSHCPSVLIKQVKNHYMDVHEL